MKKLIGLSLLLISTSAIVHAQDEGEIVKRDRIARDNSIFIDFGPSVTLGKNIGDYEAGFSFELGYLKRVNRVLSIGPSISFLSFEYDPAVTTANGGGAYIGFGDVNEWEEKYDVDLSDLPYGFVLNLKGGDLSIASFAVNFKLNIVPIKENTKLSVYGFAKPFVAVASRTDVSGTDTRYIYEAYEDDQGTPETFDDLLYYDLGDEQWYADGYESEWGPETFDALKSDSEVTGGIFLGPGVELFPTRKFTAFLQASFGYTFPVTFVSTSSYENTVEDYYDPEFPMVKKGFPSVNIQFGASFNF
jgi:hypothetical protein